MKKVVSILISAVLFFSILTIGVSAHVGPVIDNNIFYVELPEGFEFDQLMSQNYYAEHNESFTSVEFYVAGNTAFTEGLKNTGEVDIEMFVRRELEDFSGSFSSIERGLCNGVTAAVLYFVDSFELNHEIYLFATRENICIIDFTLISEDNEEKELIKHTLLSFVLNGTTFDGESFMMEHDFTGAPDYYDKINEYAAEYYKESAELDASFYSIFLIIGFVALCLPALILLLIIFIALYKKQKKLNKEYEEYVGPISLVKHAFGDTKLNNADFVPYSPQVPFTPNAPIDTPYYPNMTNIPVMTNVPNTQTVPDMTNIPNMINIQNTQNSPITQAGPVASTEEAFANASVEMHGDGSESVQTQQTSDNGQIN